MTASPVDLPEQLMSGTKLVTVHGRIPVKLIGYQSLVTGTLKTDTRWLTVELPNLRRVQVFHKWLEENG